MRIVIVEDDILFAERAEKTIQDFFTAKGEVIEIRRLEATTLLEELNGQKNYDIYLFDVEMPGMNGLSHEKGSVQRPERADRISHFL